MLQTKKRGARIVLGEVRKWMVDIAIQTIIRRERGRPRLCTLSELAQKRKNNSRFASRMALCGLHRVEHLLDFPKKRFAKWTRIMKFGLELTAPLHLHGRPSCVN